MSALAACFVGIDNIFNSSRHQRHRKFGAGAPRHTALRSHQKQKAGKSHPCSTRSKLGGLLASMRTKVLPLFASKIKNRGRLRPFVRQHKKQSLYLLQLSFPAPSYLANMTLRRDPSPIHARATTVRLPCRQRFELQHATANLPRTQSPSSPPTPMAPTTPPRLPLTATTKTQNGVDGNYNTTACQHDTPRQTAPRTASDEQCFDVRCSPFAVRRSSFVVRRSPFAAVGRRSPRRRCHGHQYLHWGQRSGPGLLLPFNIVLGSALPLRSLVLDVNVVTAVVIAVNAFVGCWSSFVSAD